MRVNNVIKNNEDIIKYINSKDFIFDNREINEEKGLEFKDIFGSSRFSSLRSVNFDDTLYNLINSNFSESEQTVFDFMQIQRYQEGDYILPHRDNYLSKLRLFQLSTNTLNGLTVQEKEGYKFYEDIAGCEIKFNRNAYHWVNPTRGEVRYTLVIGLVN